jgi:hypothetical protein
LHVVPIVHREGPYAVYFYSVDGAEPAHVHVRRDECVAKVWLAPVTLARAKGFTAREISHIVKLVRRNRFLLMGRWNDFFGR